MNHRRQFLKLTAATAALALTPMRDSYAALLVGKDYALVEFPQATTDPKRVEILELFFYGCPHCFELEPALVSWTKRLPKYAYFRRMPAIFSDSWVPMAKAFYAAEALGVTEKLHSDMFNAIHLQGINLNNKETLLRFVGSHGVDAKKFAAAFDSFGVQNKVQQARDLTNTYGIQGVPSLIVDGKYRTSSSMAGSHEKLLTALDELIALAYREHRGKR
jgi:thiol:disulfide interchange protein DsbA